MDKKEVILEAIDIDRMLTRMTHALLEVHRGSDNLVLIGIRTGGVYLAQRIQKKVFDIEHNSIPTASVDITLYRDDWTRIASHPILQGTEIPFSIDDMQVVLVDDVLFTGRTVRAAMDSLIDFGRPSRIELMVLVDRGHRELPIQANYCGKFVETKREQMINVYLKENNSQDSVVLEG